MKKKIFVCIVLTFIIMLVGCGKAEEPKVESKEEVKVDPGLDKTQKYDYAYIVLPNDSLVEGSIREWNIYNTIAVITFESGSVFIDNTDSISFLSGGEMFLTDISKVTLVKRN